MLLIFNITFHFVQKNAVLVEVVQKRQQDVNDLVMFINLSSDDNRFIVNLNERSTLRAS